MFQRRRRTTRRSQRLAHEERSHTGATSLAGDAGKAQAEALTDQLHEVEHPNVHRCVHDTGKITKIARVFGAGTTACVLLGVTLVNVAAAENTVAPHTLVGPDVAAVSAPTPESRYVAVTPNRSGSGAWLLEPDGSVRTAGRARRVAAAATDPISNPAVDLAPAERGVWVLAQRGRLTPRGGAPSIGRPPQVDAGRGYVALAASPSGRGAWALRRDGKIVALGRARHRGDAVGKLAGDRAVDLAAAPDGRGYYLVTARGRVLAFGSARNVGDPFGFIGPDVVGIAADDDGSGYWIALDTNLVLPYRAGRLRAPFARNGGVGIVDITAHPDGSYRTLHGVAVDHLHPFLVCTRSHESSHTPPAYDDGYGAVNPSGTYRGAYQFSRSTWDSTARHAGRPDLVGVDPAAASVVDQDTLALDLYEWQGADPWIGRCAGL